MQKILPDNFSFLHADMIFKAHNNHELTILGFRRTDTSAIQKLFPSNGVEYVMPNHIYPGSPVEYIADSTLNHVNVDNIPYAIEATQAVSVKRRVSSTNLLVFSNLKIHNLKTGDTLLVDLVVSLAKHNIRNTALAMLPLDRIHTLIGKHPSGCENTRLQFIRTKEQHIAMSLSYTTKNPTGVSIVHRQAVPLRSLDELKYRQYSDDICVLGFLLEGDTKLTNVVVKVA